MIDANAVLRRHPRVVHRPLADGVSLVVLHLDTAAYHGFEGAGSVVWEVLSEEPTLTELISAVRERVDDAPATLEAEVATFVEQLVERDLVVVDEQGAAHSGARSTQL